MKKDGKITRFFDRRIDFTMDLAINQSYLEAFLKKRFSNFKSDLPSFYIDSPLITSYYYYFYFY